MSEISISSIGAVLPTTATGYVQQPQAIPGALGISGAQGISGAPGSAETQNATGPQSNSFASVLGGAVDEVQGLQATSRNLTVQALTGDLNDLHNATLASARSSLALETIATFRNRGVEAFNEIMRMQA